MKFIQTHVHSETTSDNHVSFIRVSVLLLYPYQLLGPSKSDRILVCCLLSVRLALIDFYEAHYKLIAVVLVP